MKVQELLRQAQKAQQELQEQLGRLEVEGTAGSGMVTVRLSGLKELRGVQFSAEALQQGDPELLADLVMVAWEEAAQKADSKARELLSRLGLPGGLF